MVPHVHRCGSSYIDANSTKQNTMLPNLTLPRVPNVLPKRDRNSETTMGSTCAIVAPSTDGACNILTAPVHNAHLMVQTRRHPRWGPPCRSPALPAFRCPTERGGGGCCCADVLPLLGACTMLQTMCATCRTASVCPARLYNLHPSWPGP